MATKDVGLRIRVERNLRDDFLEACRGQDKPAAQVLREFMRGYVAQQAAVDRSSLIAGESQKSTYVGGGAIEKKRQHRRQRFDP
jgi:hypothetical protein